MPASASRHDHFPRRDAARRDAIRAAVARLDAAWGAADTASDGLLTAIAAQAGAAPAAAIAALRPWLSDRRWLAARIDGALALLCADPFARPPLRAIGGGESSGGEAQPNLVAAGEGAGAFATHQNIAAQTRRDPSPGPAGHPLPQGERGGNKRIRIGFVSTNSITQGEQVAQLWPILFDRYGLEIAFAHRTFSWGSEARGKAHVHVVIIGLAHRDHEPAEKRLFSYPDIKGDPVESRHGALTAYLFDAKGVANRHLVIKEESRPINGADRIVIGSKPIDGGYLIFDSSERAELLSKEPEASNFLRPFIGAEEFINGGDRWIAALQEVPPAQLRQMPNLLDRVSRVRLYREGKIPAKGKAEEKKKVPGLSAAALASMPTAFHVTVMPSDPFLAIPEVSSEKREVIPIGWLEPPVIPSNRVKILLNATRWDFGVLTSKIHMAWMRQVCGRLESRFLYSIGIVYNNFPWPEATPAQRAKIETLAQAVLDARAAHPTSSLADLYDPDTMPGNLRKAHAALDAAVDKLYRAAPFASDRDRVEHLFGRYEALVNPLEREAAKQNKRVARKAAKQG